jgi:hypothetical protein
MSFSANKIISNTPNKTYNWLSGRIPGGGFNFNNIYSYCYGDGRVVQVGETLAYSDDNGLTWKYIAFNNDLRFLDQITYGDGKFVSISQNLGSVQSPYYFIANSTDGVNWSKSGSINFEIREIKFSDGKFIINPYVNFRRYQWAYSNDGINWVTPQSRTRTTPVIYGNNIFAYCDANLFYLSSDGVNWNTLPFGSLSIGVTRNIIYGNNKFIVFCGEEGYPAIYTNNNGSSWSPCNNVPNNAYFDDPFYANGKFTISSSNGGLKSSDGINWESSSFRKIEYSNGFYFSYVILSGQPSFRQYSSNFIDWTGTRFPQETDWLSLTFSNNKFVSVGGFGNGGSPDTDGTNVGIYSINGINWESFELPGYEAFLQPYLNWYSSFYVNSRLFAYGRVMNSLNTRMGAYSDDNGLTWTTFDLIDGVSTSISYINNIFIGTPASLPFSYSYDGINWELAPGSDNLSYREPAYGNGYFVTINKGSNSGQNERGIAYSTNGVNWNFLNALPPNGGANTFPPGGFNWQNIVFGNGVFFALSQFAGAYSYDGLTWNAVQLPRVSTGSSPDEFIRVAYGDNKFVVVTARNKTVLYSSDAINWTRTKEMPANYAYSLIAYGNNTFVTFATGDNRLNSAYTG